MVISKKVTLIWEMIMTAFDLRLKLTEVHRVKKTAEYAGSGR